MMFSKKDYNAIAAMIRLRFGPCGDDWTVRMFISNLEDYLAVDNPRFDRQRFREACGYREEQ